MELRLQEAGFQHITFLGDYNYTPFQEQSPRLLIIAHL
jgi:hypothetical protein